MIKDRDQRGCVRGDRQDARARVRRKAPSNGAGTSGYTAFQGCIDPSRSDIGVFSDGGGGCSGGAVVLTSAAAAKRLPIFSIARKVVRMHPARPAIVSKASIWTTRINSIQSSLSLSLFSWAIGPVGAREPWLSAHPRECRVVRRRWPAPVS